MATVKYQLTAPQIETQTAIRWLAGLLPRLTCGIPLRQHQCTPIRLVVVLLRLSRAETFGQAFRQWFSVDVFP